MSAQSESDMIADRLRAVALVEATIDDEKHFAVCEMLALLDQDEMLDLVWELAYVARHAMTAGTGSDEATLAHLDQYRQLLLGGGAS